MWQAHTVPPREWTGPEPTCTAQLWDDICTCAVLFSGSYWLWDTPLVGVASGPISDARSVLLPSWALGCLLAQPLCHAPIGARLIQLQSSNFGGCGLATCAAEIRACHIAPPLCLVVRLHVGTDSVLAPGLGIGLISCQ